MTTFQDFCHELIENIENMAFKVPDDVTSNQRLHDLNSLNHLICHPNLLYRYLKSEMKTTLYFNMVFAVLLVWYIPMYLQMACETDNFMALYQMQGVFHGLKSQPGHIFRVFGRSFPNLAIIFEERH